MQSDFKNSIRSRQSGATLVMALIVLVLIMMLGIAAVNTSNTQFKITANLQLEDTAFNNAEVAVSAAEQWLLDASVPPNYANTDFFTTQVTPGLMQPTATNSPLALTWTDADSVPVNVNSRYTIQLLSVNSITAGSSAALGKQVVGGCTKVNTYLITGYGTSARGAKKFIQSYFARSTC
jgi:Tfp pilus assembly protein PilX